MQAAFSCPWICIRTLILASQPSGVCLMSVSVASARIFEPDGTGAGKRSRSIP
jgi:hypothetical protein